MGGIGTGGFELRQDGTFRNWSIFNNLPLNRGNALDVVEHNVLFFLIKIQERGGNPRLRVLQIEESHNVAGMTHHEFHYIFPWLDGVDVIRCSATFPFVKLEFEDRGLPLEVTMEAWSPFIPLNVKDSALPLAYFDFNIRSKAKRPADVTLIATIHNHAGYDLKSLHRTARTVDGPGFRGFEMGCCEADPAHPSVGTVSIASLHEDSHYYLSWGHLHQFYERLLREHTLPDFDNTNPGANTIDKKTGLPAVQPVCYSSIGRTVTLEPGQAFAHSFAVAWHFPNRYAQLPGENPHGPSEFLRNPEAARPPVEGHYYANFFGDAGAVAAYAVAERNRLHTETRRFHDAFYDSSVEPFLLDQVNSHLNTFRTSAWLTKAGGFGILEGLNPWKGFAGLATMDVAMYGAVCVAALFPELDRSTLLAHAKLQNADGSTAHSIAMNFTAESITEVSDVHSSTRVDLPGQFAYMALRAAFWANDRAFLAKIWPHVKRALDYVLDKRDPNGDGLPDMEGIMCSYDNFPMYGVAPFVAVQFLSGVSAAVEAARVLGDTEAMEKYGAVLRSGRCVVEEKAWNGSYYRLYNDEGGRHGGKDEGCMTDQILGQWTNHLADLEPILDQERVVKALQSTLDSNFLPEQGLRNCCWPGDGYLHPVAADCWADQANTCWTGSELAFASLLIYEGLYEEAICVVKNVDDRYRHWGMYWDHQEYGGHYFRPMSAWGLMHAILGQRLRNGVLTFHPNTPGGIVKSLFVTPSGYGHLIHTAEGYEIAMLSGMLGVTELRLAANDDTQTRVTLDGDAVGDAHATFREGYVRLTGKAVEKLAAGQRLRIGMKWLVAHALSA